MLVAVAEDLQKRADELTHYLFEQKHPALYRAWRLGDSSGEILRTSLAMQRLALTIAIFERNQQDMEVMARALRDVGKEAAALMATVRAKLSHGADGG